MSGEEVLLAGVPPGDGMDRHVLPVGAQVILDEPGFLDAVMASAWWVAPKDRPVPVTELCGQAESFVLLAADGTGKTTVLRNLRGREPGAIEINLSTLGRAEMRERLQDAATGDVPVYLDAIDSAARLEPAVYGILQECLTMPDAARVPWRLACRPAAWDGGSRRRSGPVSGRSGSCGCCR